MNGGSEEHRRRWLERRQRMAGAATSAAGDVSNSVRQLYEVFPYPSREQTAPIQDLSNAIELLLGERDIDGWRILDAGCGTGQRLVGMASRYPRAQFVGFDLSANSLAAVATLVAQHGLENVTLRQGNLVTDRDLGRFDLIVSTGVLHHLEVPRLGVHALTHALEDHGLLYLWLYHSFGEFDRMLQRDLVSLFRGESADLQEGLAIVDALALHLPTEQYGTTGALQREAQEWQQSKLADAFLHPVVHCLRIEQALDLFDGAGAQWGAVNGCNVPGRSYLFDLQRLAAGLERQLCIYPETIFEHVELRRRALGFDSLRQARALELALKPTGFSIVAGKADSLHRCTQRLQGNVLRRW
jgi:trans-aconitate methyltransferase